MCAALWLYMPFKCVCFSVVVDAWGVSTYETTTIWQGDLSQSNTLANKKRLNVLVEAINNTED